MDSTGGNDEEYKTSLIVLPSYSENSDSDGVTGKDYCSCALREFCFINLKLKENLSTRRCPILFLFVICTLLVTLSSFFFTFVIVLKVSRLEWSCFYCNSLFHLPFKLQSSRPRERLWKRQRTRKKTPFNSQLIIFVCVRVCVREIGIGWPISIRRINHWYCSDRRIWDKKCV